MDGWHAEPGTLGSAAVALSESSEALQTGDVTAPSLVTGHVALGSARSADVQVAAAAADVLTWLAGVEMLIAERQHEYARRMFQLQVEAASGNGDQARLCDARASARRALEEVRQLLGAFCDTLSRLPQELSQTIAPNSILSSVPANSAAAAPARIEAIDKLPAFLVDTKADCPICLAQLADAGGDAVALPCGGAAQHWFHRKCLREWCQLADHCPLCRTPIVNASPRAALDATCSSEAPAQVFSRASAAAAFAVEVSEGLSDVAVLRNNQQLRAGVAEAAATAAMATLPRPSPSPSPSTPLSRPNTAGGNDARRNRLRSQGQRARGSSVPPAPSAPVPASANTGATGAGHLAPRVVEWEPPISAATSASSKNFVAWEAPGHGEGSVARRQRKLMRSASKPVTQADVPSRPSRPGSAAAGTLGVATPTLAVLDLPAPVSNTRTAGRAGAFRPDKLRPRTPGAKGRTSSVGAMRSSAGEECRGHDGVPLCQIASGAPAAEVARRRPSSAARGPPALSRAASAPQSRFRGSADGLFSNPVRESAVTAAGSVATVLRPRLAGWRPMSGSEGRRSSV